MTLNIFRGLYNLITRWLIHEFPPRSVPLCDFERLSYEIRPCDVLLIEGRSRVSEVIKQITQSPWSHSMLYLGRLHDIQDPAIRQRVAEFYSADPHEQLVLESMMGQGTIITPLTHYKQDHIRICRPKGISHRDAQRVIGYAIKHLGIQYDVRQLLDLARFFYPWAIMPRRWRSSLFSSHPGRETKMVCSTIIAEAFRSVKFPILPTVRPHDEYGMQLLPRNPRLMTPRDFDYSPYFEIIKYPFITIENHLPYRNLPWAEEHHVSNADEDDLFCPVNLEMSQIKSRKRLLSTEITDTMSKKLVDFDDEQEVQKVEPVFILEQAKPSKMSRFTPNFLKRTAPSAVSVKVEEDTATEKNHDETDEIARVNLPTELTPVLDIDSNTTFENQDEPPTLEAKPLTEPVTKKRFFKLRSKQRKTYVSQQESTQASDKTSDSKDSANVSKSNNKTKTDDVV